MHCVTNWLLVTECGRNVKELGRKSGEIAVLVGVIGIDINERHISHEFVSSKACREELG